MKRRRVEGAGQVWEHEWIEIELHDSQAALIQLGRHHGLFSERFTAQATLSVEGLDDVLEKAYGAHSKARSKRDNSNRR